MIITKNSLSFPGTMSAEQQGNRSDAGLTSVKTDGITITGDGIAAPLALGPGVMDGMGSYIFARSEVALVSSAVYDRPELNRGDTVPGSKLMAARLNGSTFAMPYSSGVYGEIPGTWQYLGSVARGDVVNALLRRVA